MGLPNLTPESLPGSLSHLESQRCIAISGIDAENFLQGQFTNDLDRLDTGDQQLNCYCNPKGRALSVFRLARDENRWYMFLPAGLADMMQKRLMLYRMRAKVTIELLHDHLIYGAVNADAKVREMADTHQHWTIDQHRVLILSTEGLDLHSEESLWTTAEILSGTPSVIAETSEQFIPQHINLDLVDGVSFSKGCYPGQEIVARLRYLGKMKQRMIGGWCEWPDTQHPPLAGMPLLSSTENQRKIGQVVRASVWEGICYFLLNVPTALIDKGDLFLDNAGRNEIERFPLPYPITLGKK